MRTKPFRITQEDRYLTSSDNSILSLTHDPIGLVSPQTTLLQVGSHSNIPLPTTSPNPAFSPLPSRFSLLFSLYTPPPPSQLLLSEKPTRVFLRCVVNVADNSRQIGLRLDNHHPMCHEILHLLQLFLNLLQVLRWRECRR